MNNKEINLKVITRRYRNIGPAAKGFRTINSLIKNNEVVSLNFLFRDHKVNPIYSTIEFQERNNIDYLIDYYSILEIGLISGYFPNPLPKKLESEIKFLLTNMFVNKYLVKHYPLVLPQLLLKHITICAGDKYFENKTSIESLKIFERFLMLNNLLQTDVDIAQFLWFLDDGWSSGYSKSDFWNALKGSAIIKYKLSNNKKNPLNSALWGFIKYIHFLSDFAILLRDCKEDTLLQSALWHHQTYWFKNMKNKTEEIIKIGIENIRQSIDKINTNEIIKGKKACMNLTDYNMQLQSDVNQLKNIEIDIKYLLNDKLGEPLLKFFNNLVFKQNIKDVNTKGSTRTQQNDNRKPGIAAS